MDVLQRWLGSQLAPVFVFGVVVVSVVVMAFAPRPIKRRLRGSLILALIYGLLTFAATRFVVESMERRDLNAIALACGALALARLVFVLVVDLGVERAGAAPMNQLSRDVLQAAVYLVVAGSALRAGGLPPTSLIATGTVVTAIVGLSLQETLGNLAAGVAIQIDKPIALGEWLHMDKGDQIGRVVSTNWRAVTIQTDDRALFIVPNGYFAKTPFVNHSRPGKATRRSLYYTIPYDVAPTHVHEALLAACSDSPEVLDDPPANALTWTFGENGITYWLRYYIADFARRDISQGDVGTRVWFHLHRRKISEAIPQRQNYVYRVDEESLATKSADVVRDRRAAIDAVDFLKPLSSEAKDELARRGHRKLFAPKETIIRHGETGREFFIIRRGIVSVRIGDHEFARLGAGDFFGELALLTGSARFATVIAVEETEVFEVDEAMFRDVLRSEPSIAEEISRIVGRRQAELDARRSGSGEASAVAVQGTSSAILDKIKELFALD